MLIPALFHWSPADRYEAILAGGLCPGKPPVVSSGPQPHVCLSPSPSAAWGLSGATGWAGAAAWDLWQVRLADTDEVHIPPLWGKALQEVCVRNPIAPDRIWWVARRMTAPR